MENTPDEIISKWLELKIFFIKRFKNPNKHPEFLFYFLLIIIGFGGIGVWYSISQEVSKEIWNHSNIIGNMLSFSIAILAAGSLELMFVENPVIKNTLLLLSISVIVIFTILFFTFISSENKVVYSFVIPICLFSLLIWWVGNAENANLTKNYFKERSKESKQLNDALDAYEG